jgi:hypothetical protein
MQCGGGGRERGRGGEKDAEAEAEVEAEAEAKAEAEASGICCLPPSPPCKLSTIGRGHQRLRRHCWEEIKNNGNDTHW